MRLPIQLTANAHWLLRIALASVFLFHGLLKFANIEGFAAMLPITYSEVILVALAETGGALLLLLGGLGQTRIFDLATRLGALMNVPVMIGAIAMVHWGRWNFLPSDTHPIGGMEFQSVLILVMLYIAIIGNNAFQSADSHNFHPDHA